MHMVFRPYIGQHAEYFDATAVDVLTWSTSSRGKTPIMALVLSCEPYKVVVRSVRQNTGTIYWALGETLGDYFLFTTITFAPRLLRFGIRFFAWFSSYIHNTNKLGCVFSSSFRAWVGVNFGKKVLKNVNFTSRSNQKEWKKDRLLVCQYCNEEQPCRILYSISQKLGFKFLKMTCFVFRLSLERARIFQY